MTRGQKQLVFPNKHFGNALTSWSRQYSLTPTPGEGLDETILSTSKETKSVGNDEPDLAIYVSGMFKDKREIGSSLSGTTSSKEKKILLWRVKQCIRHLF